MNGQLSIVCNHVNGKLEGEYISYHENGQLDWSCNYINDKKEGEQKFYMNGELKEIKNYINGVEV
jgi:antitoxin component YwqK of YwqJK toxin-antitoxin module